MRGHFRHFPCLRAVCGTSALVAAAFILSLAAPLAQAQDPQQIAGELLSSALETSDARHADVQQAVVRFVNGDLEGAKRFLEMAKEKDPRLAPPDTMLARLLTISQAPANIHVALDAAVAAAPSDPEAYLMLGQLAVNEQHWTDAQLLFERGQALNEEYSENGYRRRNLMIMALSGLEAVNARRGEWEQAAQYAEKWLELKPNDPQGLFRLARDLFQVGGQENRQRAYDLLGQAHDEDANLPIKEIAMAQLYINLSPPEYRRNLIDLAIQRDPNSLPTRLAVARWALAAGELDLAKQNVDAARAIEPDNLDALVLAGTIGRYLKDYDYAEAALQQAHLLAPSSMNVSNLLALTLAEEPAESKRQQALQYALANWDRLEESYPGSPDARDAAMTLAWCYYQAGNLEEGLRVTSDVLGRRQALLGDSAFYAANMYFRHDRSQVARQILELALANSGSFATRADAEELLNKIPASGQAPATSAE